VVGTEPHTEEDVFDEERFAVFVIETGDSGQIEPSGSRR